MYKAHRAKFLLYNALREELINYTTYPIIISVVVRLFESLGGKLPVEIDNIQWIKDTNNFQKKLTGN